MRLQHNLETKPDYQPQAVEVSDPLDANEECYLVIPGHWLKSHDSSAEGKLKASLEQFVRDPVVFASTTSENNYDFENSDNAAIHLKWPITIYEQAYLRQRRIRVRLFALL